jgi:methionyl-tRNA formyltransferase
MTTMTAMTGPRSILIGSGSLASQCGDLLLARGHQLGCVLTDDAWLADWAGTRGLVRRPCADAATVLRAQPPDYLFSIVNGAVLDGETLTLIRRRAINYHDAPLPRYAGMHATSWALLAGEPAYAISWHVMAARVDAGEVLRQPPVPILPDDTAFRLNGRCWAVAMESFAGLVDDLAAGEARPIHQDLAARSYFGRYRKPPAAGVLRWDAPAMEAERLVRALDFGPQPNPLAAAKLLLRAGVLVVRRAAIGARVDAPPGRVLRLDLDGMDGLVVACADRELLVTELEDSAGSPVDLRRLSYAYGVTVGGQLPVLDPPARDRLDRWASRCAPYEMAWASRLTGLRPGLPGCDLGSRRSGRSVVAASGNGRAILAALAAYLGRTTEGDAADVAFSPATVRGDLAGHPEAPVFADMVPLRLPLSRTGTVTDLDRSVAEAISRCEAQVTYPRDLIGRVPELRGRPPMLPIGVMVLGDGEPAALVPATAVTLACRPTTGDWWLLRDPDAMTPRDASLLDQCLARLAATPADTPVDDLLWAPPEIAGTPQPWPGTTAVACGEASASAAAAINQALDRAVLQPAPSLPHPVVVGGVAELREYLDAGHPVRAACVVEPVLRRRDVTDLTAVLGTAPLWHAYLPEPSVVAAVGPAGEPLQALAGVTVRALAANGAPLPAGLVGRLSVDTGSGWAPVAERGRVWLDGTVECLSQPDSPLPAAPRPRQDLFPSPPNHDKESHVRRRG